MRKLMNNLNIPELLELAKKATPGPWETHNMTFNDPEYQGVTGDGEVVVSDIENKNAQYIASLSPDIIIPLLERLMELEEEVKQFRWEARE